MVFGLSASALSLSYNVSAAKTEVLLEQTGGDEVQDYIPLAHMVKLSYEEPDIPLTLDAAPSTAEITITLHDAEGVVLAGIPYQVTIQFLDEEADPVVMADEDCDGIIRYENPRPGGYTVTMTSIEGFGTPDPVNVTVEKPVEHKAVKVEVKKASNAELAQEDAKYGQATQGGSAVTIVDTVEYVESTKTTIPGSGEEVVVKDENGNILYISKPKTVTVDGEQYLVNPDGSTSGVKVTLNSDGTIATAVVYETIGVGGDEEGGEGEGTEPAPDVPADPAPSGEDEPSGGEGTSEGGNEGGGSQGGEENQGGENTQGGEENQGGGEGSGGGTQEEPVKDWVDCKSKVIDAYGAPVKDSSGNYLYQFESVEEKKEMTGEKIKYTGWQDIDGKRYYFDKNGNKVTGKQVIQGKEVTFGADGALITTTTKGIDVSQWNCYSTIDWNAVKNSGVDFVIVRCGLRGSTAGGIYEDDMFVSNIRGAKAAGLKVGVYFFTLAATELQAVEEASACIQMVRKAGVGLEYPIFMDLEDPVSSGAQAAGFKVLSNAQRTQVVNAFCETVRNSGYRAGLYANKFWLSAKVNTGALGSGTVIWLAHYTSKTDYAGRYEMWQYSGSGSCPGISGAVDMNISYLGY